VADAWEGVLARLEGIGAAVESARPGTAFFAADGLRRLHGGFGIDGVVAAARRALGVPARLGAGPSRFCALAGAVRARSRRAEVVRGAQDLAGQPVALLRRREEVAGLVEPLEQLGIGTLGALAGLSAAAVADRFGPAGLRAHALARGEDEPLRPRVPGETLEESLELAESASGTQLHRALELLVDRLLARRERRGRTIRAVVLGARLVEGGTWRERVVFREALADAQRMRLALGGRLDLLPAPAEALRLAVDRFGPPNRPGEALFEDTLAARRARLREAVRQARAAAGPDAALRVLTVDPDSRVPERRAVLAPFE
jgi:protein ImuB